MAAHMKFFLTCGGISYRFSVINAFAEMNELREIMNTISIGSKNTIS